MATVRFVVPSKCPFCPKQIEDLQKDFNDELSRTEYGLSGLCQECQDRVFSEEE